MGQPQRQFPSRWELFCTGLHIAVVPTRAAQPTDNGAVERLHWTMDAVLIGPEYGSLDSNISIGKQRAGHSVTLRFDPSDRKVVVYELGTSPGLLGPEIKRFYCPAFDKATILGTSPVATHPFADPGGTFG